MTTLAEQVAAFEKKFAQLHEEVVGLRRMIAVLALREGGRLQISDHDLENFGHLENKRLVVERFEPSGCWIVSVANTN